ncbi:hypothetical protein CR513_03377, partial [Mucuna pruriens]
MEMDLMRVQIGESEEATMAYTLSELFHQAIKVKMQIRRRSTSRKTYMGSSSWKGKEKKKENLKRGNLPPTPYALRTSNIKCFKCLDKGSITSKCPNRRVMVIKDNEKVEIESSPREQTSSSEVESLND